MHTFPACMPRCGFGADKRKQLERLCRYITRIAIARERLDSGTGYDRSGSVVAVRLNEKLPIE